MSCTVDASVFVAAARKNDVHHLPSREFLFRAASASVPLVCPTLVLPESVAALARETGDPELAVRLVHAMLDTANLHLVALDAARAEQAAWVAANQRLKGADAVYVAVAEAAGTTLVTWDTEMLERCPGSVRCVTPPDWVAALP